jgi:hypothetical protein
MTKKQAIALAIAAVNLALILLFPPFDAYSIASAQVPVFAGFNFFLSRTQYMVVNSDMLFIEIFVVLINANIALLLLGKKKALVKRHRVSMQNASLIIVAVNLVVIILFPPFESVYSMTKAAIPTFEGFYFIFARQSGHVIVSTILYLEVFFVLINGALLWLIFRERKAVALTPEEAAKLIRQIRRQGG